MTSKKNIGVSHNVSHCSPKGLLLFCRIMYTKRLNYIANLRLTACQKYSTSFFKGGLICQS